MTVRTLTFASLLFAAAHPSFAETPAAAANDVPTHSQVTAESGDLPLEGRWKTSVKDGVLVADLTLVNTSKSAVDIVVAYGRSPGTYVRADMDGARLDQVLDQAQRGERMSRMGPMPKFGPIAAGKELVAGTFKFTLPQGYAGKSIELQATVESPDGRTLVIPFTLVLGPTKAV